MNGLHVHVHKVLLHLPTAAAVSDPLCWPQQPGQGRGPGRGLVPQDHAGELQARWRGEAKGHPHEPTRGPQPSLRWEVPGACYMQMRLHVQCTMYNVRTVCTLGGALTLQPNDLLPLAWLCIVACVYIYLYVLVVKWLFLWIGQICKMSLHVHVQCTCTCRWMDMHTFLRVFTAVTSLPHSESASHLLVCTITSFGS